MTQPNLRQARQVALDAIKEIDGMVTNSPDDFSANMALMKIRFKSIADLLNNESDNIIEFESAS